MHTNPGKPSFLEIQVCCLNLFLTSSELQYCFDHDQSSFKFLLRLIVSSPLHFTNVVDTIIAYSLKASKKFRLIRDLGKHPLNTSQTTWSQICGEKLSQAMFLNQQIKVLLAPRFYASGNFLQVVGNTVGVNKATVLRQFLTGNIINFIVHIV